VDTAYPMTDTLYCDEDALALYTATR